MPVEIILNLDLAVAYEGARRVEDWPDAPGDPIAYDLVDDWPGKSDGGSA
jgi:hypothetical protein